MYEEVGVVGVEADEPDVTPAAEKGEVGDGLGEFEGDGGLRAHGDVEFAVGALVGGAQLTPYVGDVVEGDPQIDVHGMADPQ